MYHHPFITEASIIKEYCYLILVGIYTKAYFGMPTKISCRQCIEQEGPTHTLQVTGGDTSPIYAMSHWQGHPAHMLLVTGMHAIAMGHWSLITPTASEIEISHSCNLCHESCLACHGWHWSLLYMSWMIWKSHALAMGGTEDSHACLLVVWKISLRPSCTMTYFAKCWFSSLIQIWLSSSSFSVSPWIILLISLLSQ